MCLPSAICRLMELTGNQGNWAPICGEIAYIWSVFLNEDTNGSNEDVAHHAFGLARTEH